MWRYLAAFALGGGPLTLANWHSICATVLALLSSAGKATVEIGTVAELVPTLELLKRAVEAGELDAQIEAAAIKLREGFGK